MSVHQLVADFLKQNNYFSTLETFEREHGTPIDLKTPLDESLEDILRDRGIFKQTDASPDEEYHSSLSEALQKLSLTLPTWNTPYPKTPTIECVLPALLVSSYWHQKSRSLIASGADFKIYEISLIKGSVLVRCIPGPAEKVVVKKIVGYDDVLYFVGMNGRIWRGEINTEILSSVVENDESNDTEQSFNIKIDPEFTQAHERLVSDARIHTTTTGNRFLVTLGWDFRAKVFAIEHTLLSLHAEIRFPVQGACFTTASINGEDLIVVGKLESTVLDVYDLDLQLQHRIALNDAEFNTSGFTPRSLSFHDGFLAVATSHLPYMRLIIVALQKMDPSVPIQRNQILRNISTVAPQDKFLQPIVTFRSSGAGVWIASDDGTLRGYDLQTGAVAVELVLLHSTRINTLVVGSDPECCITSSADKSIHIWS